MFEILTTTLSDVLSNLDLSEITQKVADSMAEELEYPGGVVLLADETSSYVTPHTFSTVPVVKYARKLFDSSNIIYEFEKGRNYIELAGKNKEIYISKRQAEHISPQVNKRVADLTQRVSGTKISISLPVVVNEKVLGVLFINSSREEVSPEEMLMLKTYADQFGLAINNSRLFSETKSQVNLLAEQNKDLQSLFYLNTQISSTLDLRTVAQSAVDSLPRDDLLIGAYISMLGPEMKFLETIAVTRNKLSEKVLQLMGEVNKYKLDVTKTYDNESAIKRVLDSGSLEVTEDLSQVLSPPLPKSIAQPIEALLKIKSTAVFPLIFRGKTVGIIAYLFKNINFNDLPDRRKQLFETYTSQIAISLDNANLFTKSRKVQQSLQVALADLQETRRRERDMIDIMGHELRTPISIVKNSLSMMDRLLRTQGQIPVEKQKKYVEIGLDASRREANLIETLLSATKTDAKGFQLTLDKTDLNEVVEDSMVAFKNAAKKKGIDLTYQKPDFEPLIYADGTRVQEISDNFVSNAIKYTQEGYVSIRVYKESSLIWFEVSDSGYGISPEDLKNLGRKFYRAQQHTKGSAGAGVVRPGGTGLGLYVSFSLVKIMDGAYRVESTLGKGSKFSFGMPEYTGQKLVQVERKFGEYVQGKDSPK